MQAHSPKIGLFIDADNAPASQINFIMTDIGQHGIATTKRAYGNWQKPCLNSWAKCLSKHAIQPVQQFDVVKGKNASDIALTIDLVDSLHIDDIDLYVIISSDSDFTALVTRIRATGKQVHGYGQRNACSEFVNCCSKFIYFDRCNSKTISLLAKHGTTNHHKGLNSTDNNYTDLITKPIAPIKHAIATVRKEDGWANVSDIGQYLAKQSTFNLKEYGYLRLGYLIQSLDVLETRYEENRSKLYVRMT